MGRYDQVFEFCERSCTVGVNGVSGERVFPSIAIAIGDSNGVLAEACFGMRNLPEALPVTNKTLYDIASLSKVVATSTLFARFMELGKISVYDNLGNFFNVPDEKAAITIRQIMTHTAGLPWHIRFWELRSEIRDIAELILALPLANTPGERVVYSDPGFILLGRILEKVGGDTLDRLVSRYVFEPLGMSDSCYRPCSDDVAATEYDAVTGRIISSEVHDENARFLGGVSGHAGVFSNIGDMSRFAASMLKSCKGNNLLSPGTMRVMTSCHTAGLNDSRGLGWCVKTDEPLCGSPRGDVPCSGGDLMSGGAFGHTGFTGTSVWMSPVEDLFVVILTNRVHPTRENTQIIRFRRLVHNMIVAEHARDGL